MDSLHLTQWSRLVDAKDGDSTTNIAHLDEDIFRSLVRLALLLPVAEHLGEQTTSSSTSR